MGLTTNLANLARTTGRIGGLGRLMILPHMILPKREWQNHVWQNHGENFCWCCVSSEYKRQMESKTQYEAGETKRANQFNHGWSPMVADVGNDSPTEKRRGRIIEGRMKTTNSQKYDSAIQSFCKNNMPLEDQPEGVQAPFRFVYGFGNLKFVRVHSRRSLLAGTMQTNGDGRNAETRRTRRDAENFSP